MGRDEKDKTESYITTSVYQLYLFLPQPFTVRGWPTTILDFHSFSGAIEGRLSHCLRC